VVSVPDQEPQAEDPAVPGGRALQAGPRQDQEGGLGRSETVVVSLKENTSKSEHLDYVLKTDSSGQIKAPRRTVLEMFLL
jgi:hypothetical protein